MPSIILQPNSTGKPGGEYAVEALLPFLNESDRAQLRRAAPEGQVVAYGKAEPDASRWERIKHGDHALFYHRTQYFASARVALCVKNAKLAHFLWSGKARSDQGLHDLLIFFADLKPLALPAAELNHAAGYKAHYVLYRFNVLYPEQAQGVLSLLRDRRFRPRAADVRRDDLAFVQDIDSVVEGQEKLVQHIRRERSRKLITAKRGETLRRTGMLACEVCGFDAAAVYPWITQPFAEVHHTRPLAARDEASETSLKELAILCANCHRMIHRTVPMMSVARFRRAFLKAAANRRAKR